MYRFGLADMSVLIAATSVVVISTGVMPGWLALAGFVAAMFALLRFLIPLGAFSGCAILLVVIIEEVGIPLPIPSDFLVIFAGTMADRSLPSPPPSPNSSARRTRSTWPTRSWAGW